MSRGVSSVAITTMLFAIMMVIAIVFVINTILEPTYNVYGLVQANVLARSLATDISALSTQAEGEEIRDLGGEWDISFTVTGDGRTLQLSHGDFESQEKMIFGNIQGDFPDMIDVGNISLVKKGKMIVVSKVN